MKNSDANSPEYDILKYYRQVSSDYDKLYERKDPIRQQEIFKIEEDLKRVLRNRCVLEVACGTGFWTRIAAEIAQQIVSTDILDEMLTLAKSKLKGTDNVELMLADAYNLRSVPGFFDAGLAGFLLSHVPKARVEEFFEGFHKRLGSGAIVYIIDSVFVPGLGGELVSIPGIPGKLDTYKQRTLKDGTTYYVLKNYYNSEQVRSILSHQSENLQINFMKNYWYATYTISQD